MASEIELQQLRQELRDLSQRVASLEKKSPKKESDSKALQPPASLHENEFWALTGLRSRLSEHPSTAQGAVMLVGAVTLPTGAPVAWQQTVATSGLFEVEWEDQATPLAALGHPMRLEILRHILSGTHATAELAAIESLGTTGQLHHHLRQLLSAGWVKQSGRGSYEVPAQRIVPLLACISVVNG